MPVTLRKKSPRTAVKFLQHVVIIDALVKSRDLTAL